jgi:hypothetical protein
LHGFRRVRSSGTKAIVERHLESWNVQINVREEVQHPTTPCRLLTPTVELAKARADKELVKHGHLRILSTLDSSLILFFSLNANL